MDRRTTLQVPGCEGWHAVPVARRRPGRLAWSQVATGNEGVEGRAEVVIAQASPPRGASYRVYRLGHVARGKAPSFSSWCSQESGMSAGRKATNGADTIRNLQRALSRTSKQDKKKRFDSLDDQVWSVDVLWEAWRQVKANKGRLGSMAWRSRA